MEFVDSPLLWVAYIALGLMGISILGALFRVYRGPSLADRVIALDLVAYLTMGFLTVYAILEGEDTYIDAALVLGLLAFLGTIAVGRYIERVRSGESLLRP